jgi:fatty-acyl-CoA synthase
LPRRVVVPETSLWTNLEVSAIRYPDKAAYRFFGRSLGYAELARQAMAVAGWLQQTAEIGAGDRVALVMQNCPQMAAAFYGVMRADAVVVPVNPMNRAEELRHVLADSGARVVICAADLLPHVVAANGLLPPERALRDVVVVRYADALPARESLGPGDGMSTATGCTPRRR